MLPPLKIVEFAEGVSGPLAGCRLGDLGAEVIKVEAHEGDWLRECPPFLDDGETSAAFFALNRGKRSVALGEAPSAARELLGRLLEAADVFITDRSPGELAAVGLSGFDKDHWPRNPGLVIVCLSALGTRGPLADRPGSELTAQAMAGYTRYLGSRDRPAQRLGADVAGTATGIFATQAILAALLWRRRSGQGQRVDLSLWNSLLTMKTVHLAAQSDPDAYSGPRVGGANDPPERGWATADLPITFMLGGAVGAEGRPGWVQFVETMGLGWMVDDPRFDKTGRQTTGLGPRARELRPLYEAAFVEYPAREIVEAIRRLGGLATPYLTHAELITDPQMIALGAVQTVSRGGDGERRCLAFPARFSEGEPALRGVAPARGQHGAEIAREAGLTAEEIRQLEADGGLLPPARP